MFLFIYYRVLKGFEDYFVLYPFYTILSCSITISLTSYPFLNEKIEKLPHIEKKNIRRETNRMKQYRSWVSFSKHKSILHHLVSTLFPMKEGLFYHHIIKKVFNYYYFKIIIERNMSPYLYLK